MRDPKRFPGPIWILGADSRQLPGTANTIDFVSVPYPPTKAQVLDVARDVALDSLLPPLQRR